MRKTVALAALFASVSMVSGTAVAAKRAQSPDELPWNYFTVSNVYSYFGVEAEGLGDIRFFSDKTYKADLNLLLTESVFLGLKYAINSEGDADSTTWGGGLGFRLPLSNTTDFFVSASHETSSEENDGDDVKGLFYEAGIRSFVSGSAELSLTYTYGTAEPENSDGKSTQKYLNLGFAVPVAEGFAVTGRSEIGSAKFSEPGEDDFKFDVENFLIGVRFNFNM